MLKVFIFLLLSCCIINAAEFPAFLTDAIVKHNKHKQASEKMNEASAAFKHYKHKVVHAIASGGIVTVRSVSKDTVCNPISEFDGNAEVLVHWFLVVYYMAKFLGYGGFDADAIDRLHSFPVFLDEMHAFLLKACSTETYLAVDFFFTLRYDVTIFALKYLQYVVLFEPIDSLTNLIFTISLYTSPIDDLGAKQGWQYPSWFEKMPKLQDRSLTCHMKTREYHQTSHYTWSLETLQTIATNPNDAKAILAQSLIGSPPKETRPTQLCKIEYKTASIPIVEAMLCNRGAMPHSIVPIISSIHRFRPEYDQFATIQICFTSYLLDFFMATQIEYNEIEYYCKKYPNEFVLFSGNEKAAKSKLNEQLFFEHTRQLHVGPRIHERLFMSTLCSRLYHLASSLCLLLANNLFHGYPKHDCTTGTIIHILILIL